MINWYEIEKIGHGTAVRNEIAAAHIAGLKEAVDIITMLGEVLAATKEAETSAIVIRSRIKELEGQSDG